jgi:hypothetical protein
VPDTSVVYFYLQGVIINALRSDDEQLDHKALEIQGIKR